MNTTRGHRTIGRIGWLVAAFAMAGAILASDASRAENASLAAPFALIVHASNTFSGDEATSKSTIKQLYLKQRTAWPAGVDARPFGNNVSSEARKAFLAHVLNMTEAELADHWVSLKQKTGATPPREVDSAAMLIKFIEKYDGAFGVVTEEEAKAAGAGVKILFTFGS